MARYDQPWPGLLSKESEHFSKLQMNKMGQENSNHHLWPIKKQTEHDGHSQNKAPLQPSDDAFCPWVCWSVDMNLTWTGSTRARAIKAIFSTMKFFGSLGLARESSLMAQGR